MAKTLGRNLGPYDQQASQKVVLESLISRFFPVDMLRMFLSWFPKKMQVANIGV